MNIWKAKNNNDNNNNNHYHHHQCGSRFRRIWGDPDVGSLNSTYIWKAKKNKNKKKPHTYSHKKTQKIFESSSSINNHKTADGAAHWDYEAPEHFLTFLFSLTPSSLIFCPSHPLRWEGKLFKIEFKKGVWNKALTN